MKDMLLRYASTFGDCENSSIFDVSTNFYKPIKKIAETYGENAENIATAISLLPGMLGILIALWDYGMRTSEKCAFCGNVEHVYDCPVQSAVNILTRLGIETSDGRRW